MMRKAILLLVLFVATLVAGVVLGYLGHGYLFARLQDVALRPDPTSGKADDSRIVARIGSYELTEKEFRERWQKILTQAGRDFFRQEGGPHVYLDQVVEEKLLAQEAFARGYQDDYTLRLQLSVEEARAIARPLLRDEVRLKSFPREKLQEYYDAHRTEFHESEQVRVRDIVVTPAPFPKLAGPWNTTGDDAKTPEEARRKIASLRERALKGEDFAELAHQQSEDATAGLGGDLGLFRRGAGLIPEVEAAAFSLAPGELSQVIETQGGFHLIRVEERLPERQLTLEEARTAIVEKLLLEDPTAAQTRYKEYVVELRKKYPVEIYVEPGELGRNL